MKDWKFKISDFLMPQEPTYVGLVVRSAIVILFQDLFGISLFSFRYQAPFPPTITAMIFIIPILVGTYSLLFGYGILALIRTKIIPGKAPFYEKLVAIIVLVTMSFFIIYIVFTAPPVPQEQYFEGGRR
jgi:hypothetical protein